MSLLGFFGARWTLPLASERREYSVLLLVVLLRVLLCTFTVREVAWALYRAALAALWSVFC
jgi:hypothetical protein